MMPEIATRDGGVATPLGNLLLSLDQEQYDAVMATGRRICVTAGAGSGKTRVLVARAAHRIATGVPVDRLVVVTFSKAAGDELGHRLNSLGVTGAQSGTIHALCYKILRQELGYRGVADGSGQRRFLRAVMAEMKAKDPFQEVLREINVCKALDRPPRRYVALYDAYERKLAQARVWDFGDMVQKAHWHLRDHPEAAARWAGLWDEVLVDEAQDTSALQWAALGHLITPTTTLFMVGDAQQSIYGWRGARPDLMMAGLERPEAEAFETRPLPRNYRSVPPIVAFSNRLMAEESWWSPMTATREVSSEPMPTIEFLGPAATRHEEADAVARHLTALRVRHDWSWGRMAILYRTNAQSEPFETACMQQGIPHLVMGSVGFYARAEVLDVLAYLRATSLDPEALDRIYNRPSRYLGAVWRRELEEQGGWPAFFDDPSACSWSKPYMRKRADELYETILDLQQRLAAGSTPAALVEHVLERIGYRAWLIGEEPDEMDNVRSENLDQLQHAAGRWTSVEEFLAFTERCGPRRPQTMDFNQVRLSTIHRAKGLEFPLVVVAGLSEGVLPHRLGEPAEERRLFYVAATRAQDRLVLSSCVPVSSFWSSLQAVEPLGALMDAEASEEAHGTSDGLELPSGSARDPGPPRADTGRHGGDGPPDAAVPSGGTVGTGPGVCGPDDGV